MVARSRYVLLVTAALLSCGDNVVPGRPIALADFGEEAREAVCDWAVRCVHVPDRDTCERLIDPKDYDVRRALDAAQAGRLAFDEVLGGACVWSNREQPCMASPWSSVWCRTMFEGLVPEGGACTSPFECRGGGACDDLVCGAQCCQGACGPPEPGLEEPELAKVGETCSSHFECVFGAYCETNRRCTPDPVEEGQRCLFGCGRGDLYCDLDELVCKRFAGEGEECDPEAQSARPCDDAWSYCDEVCVPRPGGGQACDAPGAKCVATTYCQDGVCQPRGAAGDACEVGDECEVACDRDQGICVDYETCVLEGV